MTGWTSWAAIPTSFLSRVGLIGPFPREAVFLAPEVTVGSRPEVDRPAQIQGLDDARGRELEVFANEFHDARLINSGRTKTIQHHRHGLGHADRVGELDLDAVRQPCRHQILGNVAGHVAGRSIHLGGVFS